ncbi:MAG: hypothetical protein U5K32_10390 [Bacteroidales bacterium]|nr:hypothetical protein [Bacteroidales bacterium]
MNLTNYSFGTGKGEYYNTSANVNSNDYAKSYGFSVRCLRVN